MAISYNTGTTASADTAASVNITIPSGVLVSDVMLMALAIFTLDSSAPTIAFSGAGGTWTLVPVSSGTNPGISPGGGVYSYGYAYYRVATAGDPGATLTITETGSAAGTTWFAVALDSYTGANTSTPVDVAGSAVTAGDTDTYTITCPSKTTGVAGDWAVYLFPSGSEVGSTITGPAGTTQRHHVVSDAGIAAVINDSNGSAGGSGSSIGGGVFTVSGTSSATWLTAFTVGLAPAGASSPPPQVVAYMSSM